MANGMAQAKGLFSFHEERENGLYRSTPDYALLASEHASLALSFEIVEDWVSLSDHRPIVLSLATRSALRSHPLPLAQDRVRWRSQYDTPTLQHALAGTMQQWEEQRKLLLDSGVNGQRLIDSLAKSYTDGVNNALRETVGVSVRRPKPPHPFCFRSAEYNRLVERVQHSGNRLQRALRSGDVRIINRCRLEHDALRAERGALFRSKRAAVKAAFFRRVEESAREPSRFYRLYNTILSDASTSAVPSFVVSSSGVLIAEPEAVLERWRSSFASLFEPNPPCTPEAVAFEHHVMASLALRFNELPVEERAALLVSLEARVTDSEVKHAFERARRAVAPGPDGVPAWVFKDGGAPMIRTTALLFNDVLKRGVWPSEWCLGWIHPIFKKGDRAEPMDYRGISLLPIHSQLLRSIFNRRLTACIESRGLLSPFQAGFRARHGTHDHLITLHEIATDRWERGLCLYMAFLDVAKAYDRTWRDALWYRLRRIGVTDKVLRVWRSSYATVSRSVIVNEQRTAPFECASGVAQGAVDSPTLYDVFVDRVGIGDLTHAWVRCSQLPVVHTACAATDVC